MADLISREYMKSLGATCIASRSKDGTLFPIVAIDELPSVQPEIIRCKDCKHYMQTDTIHHRGWCWRWNHFTAIERYCSERALRGDSDEN